MTLSSAAAEFFKYDGSGILWNNGACAIVGECTEDGDGDKRVHDGHGIVT